jgi:hypothetical protein
VNTHQFDTKRMLKGEKAKQAILSRLVDHPAALELAKEVTDFFDGHFRYYEGEDIDISKFGLGIEPVSAFIHLKLGTSRVSESLAHELLHLKLTTRKFPRYQTIDLPDRLKKHKQALSEYYDPLLNIVQHEIMLYDFIALGFSQKDFLIQPPAPENYQGLVGDSRYQIIPEVRFPWWCLEYIRHWAHARHSILLGPVRHANDVLTFGKIEFPELPQAATQMMQLFENGHFKDASKYPSEVNKLLRIMRIPVISQWVEISSEQLGKPVAKVIKAK